MSELEGVDEEHDFHRDCVCDDCLEIDASTVHTFTVYWNPEIDRLIVEPAEAWQKMDRFDRVEHLLDVTAHFDQLYAVTLGISAKPLPPAQRKWNTVDPTMAKEQDNG